MENTILAALIVLVIVVIVILYNKSSFKVDSSVTPIVISSVDPRWGKKLFYYVGKGLYLDASPGEPPATWAIRVLSLKSGLKVGVLCWVHIDSKTEKTWFDADDDLKQRVGLPHDLRPKDSDSFIGYTVPQSLVEHVSEKPEPTEDVRSKMSFREYIKYLLTSKRDDS